MDSRESSEDGDAEMVEEIEAEMQRQEEEELMQVNVHDSDNENSQNEDQDAMSEDEAQEDQEGPPQAPMDISNSAPSIKPGMRSISILHNPPPFLANMRQALFDITMPVELKPEEFELYWPFVDNVWVRQHKAGVDRAGRNTDYYACRLQRPTYAPKKDAPRAEGKQRRIKQTRQGGTCQMRIKTVRYEGDVKKVTISRIGEHAHSHDLDAMDKLKRNTVVMEIARSEVMKGFMPASVFTVMNADPYKLAIIGGKFMKTNDVRNSSQAWRQNYTGKLAVHPGYKYDHGNGIVADMQRPSIYPGAMIVDPTLASSVPVLPPPPPGASIPTLPPDALHFPPPTAQLFVTYLPPPTPPSKDGLPFVTLTYATSLDSFLSLSPTVPTPISGPGTKSMTHFLRSHHAAILVGVGTAIADDPALNCRLAGAGGYGGLGWTSHPRPVIIDPGARWDLRPESRILQAVKQGRGRAPWVIVAPGISIPPARVELLRAHGGKYVALPDFDPRFRLRWEGILRALKEEGITSVMIEGGSMVINEMLGREENRKLINSVILTIAPTYLGAGSVHVAPIRSYNASGTPIPVCRFRDVRWYPFGEDVVMLGHVNPTDHSPLPPQSLPGGPPVTDPASAPIHLGAHAAGMPTPSPAPPHNILAPTAPMRPPSQTPVRTTGQGQDVQEAEPANDIEAAHRQLQQQLQQHALQAQQHQISRVAPQTPVQGQGRLGPPQTNGVPGGSRGNTGKKPQNIRWTSPKGPHI